MALGAGEIEGEELGSVQTLDFEGFYGEVAVGFGAPDSEAQLEQTLDVGTATEILHWGRNILWQSVWPTARGTAPVVVKQFRHEGWRKRLDRRWRGSKASRNWRMATALHTDGVPTPEPVAWIESRAPEGPAFFICRHLPDRLEARYPLRTLNGVSTTSFPEWSRDRLFGALAVLAQRLHEAGYWHRDFSAGNVLLPPSDGDPGDPVLVDLNRARRPGSLHLGHRLADLSRMPIRSREDQQAFLRRYFGRPPNLREWVGYRRRYAAFHGKHRFKRAWRAKTAGLKSLLFARKAYPHLAAPDAEAARRDRVVWDQLSDQPHQHASRWDKLAVRLADVGVHAKVVRAVFGSLPRIWRRYRTLQRELHSQPSEFSGIGLCVRPLVGHEDQLLAAIADLGVHHVLLRLHPWESDHQAEEQLARELSDRGHELVFSLPQRRELVRDPARWQAAVEELVDRFSPYGKTFQVGQAINRSKWGVWNYGEFQQLAGLAEKIVRRVPGTELVGPGVIDFEFHATAAIVNWPGQGTRFDALASLLYVDRRGAPERTQAGFDTIGKVLLAKAIADTARHCGSRSWITEVNWPLREGPHSPAGRHVSVGEDTYADYLARYYLLALGTGCVERVYWWQLEARGYGLAVLREGQLHRRPGFEALRTLNRRLTGWVFKGPLPANEGCYLYRFGHADGRRQVVAWCVDGESKVQLPEAVLGGCNRDGKPLPSSGPEVVIDGSVRYFDLQNPG